jgi:hypothetical protein
LPREAPITPNPAVEEPIRTRPVYLPPETLDLVRAERRIAGVTYTDLLVSAFEDLSDEQLRAEFAPVPRQGTAMPSRRRTRRGGGGIQVNLRLDGAQERWLNAKAEQVGAPSRSALVATVFRLHYANQTA